MLALTITLVAVAAALFAAGYFFSCRKLIQDTVRISDLTDENFVKWLQAYEVWYTKSSRTCHDWSLVFRVLPVLLGFMVAFVSAWKNEHPLGMEKNLLVMVLTGISTLCVSLLSQLRLSELAKARRRARRDLGGIMCRGT